MKVKAKTKKPVKEQVESIKEVKKDELGNVERKEAVVSEEKVRKRTESNEKPSGFIDSIKMRREKNGKIEPRYESWSDEVNEVALELAERWDYHKLRLSVDAPSKAPEIYGYLKNKYRNFDWLISNYVLEVAVFYAENKMSHKIEIYKVVEGIDLNDYVWSRVELDGIHRLENYQNIPFNSFIAISEDFLDDAVYWLEDSEWILDNEDVRVNLGRFGGVLIGKASWNVPIILVTYLPYNNKGIYKAKLDAKQIYKIEDDSKLKLINTYRTLAESFEDQIDQLERDKLNWKRMYSDLKKAYTLEYRKMVERKSIASAGVQKGSNYTSIILVIVMVVLAIVAVIGFMT